ncbi:MAG: transposase [Anaerolineales bacterium]|nr:transposase [Anaerolineales bacterium]
MSASLLAEVWWNLHMEDIYKVYPNNPPHYFLANAMYLITGSTLYKQPFLRLDSFKDFFLRTLFQRANLLGWVLQAWAVLHNHYHFIAQAPEDASSLPTLIRQLHSITAIEFNRRNSSPGRQIWYNYWDTCLTYEKAYLARLHYVHMNPVKHGLVQDAIHYPFCSYRWFMEQGDADLKVLVFEQPIDRVKIMDDF